LLLSSKPAILRVFYSGTDNRKGALPELGRYPKNHRDVPHYRQIAGSARNELCSLAPNLGP
jgi:hypothetical protein